LKQKKTYSINNIFIFYLVFLLLGCKNHNKFDKSISEVVAIDNEYIYYENYAGFIIKKSVAKNEKIWQHKKLYDLSIKVYESGESIYYTTPSEVISIDKTNGEVNFIIKEKVSSITSNFISYKSEIIASSICGVYSFSKTSGKILWSLLPSYSTILTDPKILINNDILYIAGKFGPENKCKLFAYDLRDKSKINEIDLPKEVITNITLIDNNLIFGTGQSILAREIYSIDKDNFKINWQLEHNIDHSAKIISHKNKLVFFNFKNHVFELNTQNLEFREIFKLPNNYYELFDISENKLIACSNSSLSTFSFENSIVNNYENIMTAGIWKLNDKIYFADKSEIKTISELN
jgi:hypothetical protein